jgi:hypothetical protein
MDRKLRALVVRRAKYRCEYCGLPEVHALVVPLHLEHVIAKKHHGRTRYSNLALACHHCNLHKGTDLVAIDPRTMKRASLFNPRRHKWPHHFRWEGVFLVGRTRIGRATVRLLAINDQDMIDLRTRLQEEGVFPW